MSRTQLPDDESPTRVPSLDNPILSGAFRTQEAYACHVLNAAARTINAVHVASPLDFVILGQKTKANQATNTFAVRAGMRNRLTAFRANSGANCLLNVHGAHAVRMR